MLKDAYIDPETLEIESVKDALKKAEKAYAEAIQEILSNTVISPESRRERYEAAREVVVNYVTVFYGIPENRLHTMKFNNEVLRETFDICRALSNTEKDEESEVK